MYNRKLRRIWYLLVVVIVAGLSFVFSSFKKQQQAINILMIAVDDLYTSIGATKDADGSFLKTIYPDPEIRANVAARLTPNIDRLAKEGRQFLNATCQSPLCGPSRTALMTGVPTHVSGYYSHHESFRANEVLEKVITLPQYLKSMGYYTAGIGKIFHKPVVESLTPEGDWPDTKYSWSKWISCEGGAGLGSAKQPEMSPNKGLMKFGPGNQPKEETDDWLNSVFTSTLFKTGKATKFDVFKKKDESIELPDDQPFFIASGIFRPHLPFFAPRKYFDMFPTSEMQIDEELFNWVKNDIKDIPEGGQKWIQLTKGKFYDVINRGEEVAGKQGQLEAWKQCVQAYLACVAYADDCVGEILNGLDNSKYKDNTIVFLWSDHGYFLGDKARIAKQCLWREAINCNLIIRMPKGQKKKGIPSKENVQLTDLYPTIVSLCGFDKPSHVMGEDITGLIKDPNAKLKRKYTYVTYMEGNHTVFSDKYKYIRYSNGDCELYDIQNDILEYSNLAEFPKYQNLVKEMEAMLNEQLSDGIKYTPASDN